MKNMNGFKNRFLAGVAILFAIVMISDSCSKSSSAYMNGTTGGTGGTGAGPGANEVFIQGMTFTPGSLSVTAGTTVKWTNKDQVTHTVTSTTNVFDSGNVPPNGTFSYTFATAGTYSYFCKIHTYMTGTVTAK
jgi:plastocyanin